MENERRIAVLKPRKRNWASFSYASASYRIRFLSSTHRTIFRLSFLSLAPDASFCIIATTTVLSLLVVVSDPERARKFVSLLPYPREEEH